MKLTGWSAWWTRVAKEEGEGCRVPHSKHPQVKPCRSAPKTGYNIKLAGWSAWWARVSREESRVGKVSKVDKLDASRQKNEIEKKMFVKKYFGNIKTPILTPRPDVTISSESERKTSSNVGSYPKRKQNFDNIFECGEQQSTGKIRKLDNSAGMSQFWEGGSTSTVSGVHN